MPTTRRESKMLEEVRRWRREAFEARSKRSAAERAADEQKLIESLGLTHLVQPPADSAANTRRAG